MERWASTSGITGGETVSLQQCWELARLWYAGRHHLDWQPRTPEEAEGFFRTVGLASEFWRLTPRP